MAARRAHAGRAGETVTAMPAILATARGAAVPAARGGATPAHRSWASLGARGARTPMAARRALTGTVRGARPATVVRRTGTPDAAPD